MISYIFIKKCSYKVQNIHDIVGWEEERPMSARRVRTSYLPSACKNIPSDLVRKNVPSWLKVNTRST